MTRPRTTAVFAAVAVLVLATCTSSVLAVEFTSSYTDGETWNQLYAQGFKPATDASPAPGHDAGDTVNLNRFDFYKAGLEQGGETVPEATNVSLVILDNVFTNLTGLTTTTEGVLGVSDNMIADTSTIATGDPITFNFAAGVPLEYGDAESIGDLTYAALLVTNDGSDNLTPVLVPAMTADYVDDGSGTFVPESDYGDVEFDYYLAASNFLTVDEWGTWLWMFEPAHADASFTAYFDMELPIGVTGDYNDDGTVDAADYTTWRDAMAAGATTLTNRDSGNTGTVGEADYDVWKTNYGMSSGTGAAAISAAAVPEPTTVVLFGIAAIGLWLSGIWQARNVRP